MRLPSVIACSALLVSSFATACSVTTGTAAGDDSDQDGGTTDASQGTDAARVDATGGTDAAGGDTGTEGPDAGDDDGAADAAAVADAYQPAMHAAQPLVADLGGTVLAAPKVQLIVYTEDTTAPDVDKMVTEATQTATWHEQTSEYGIGALTRLPTLSIAGTPPKMLDDNTGTITPFEQTLIDNISGNQPVWGTADPNTIYTFLLPLNTDISSGGDCCTDFDGYHWEVPVNGVAIPYAVICDCAATPNDPLTPLEDVTTTVSHELVEAATDPHPNTAPAYYQANAPNSIWTVFTGGEVADMCEYNADSNYTPAGSTYMIQRTWSNAAAMAGTNPCIPVPPTDGPFFDSMPVLPDSVMIQGAATSGVTIPVGQSKTIDVQLYSAGPTSGPWTVTAYDMNGYLGSAANTTLSLDKSTGSNGDVIHLTITVNSADKTIGGEGFLLVSDLDGQETFSMGAIGN